MTPSDDKNERFKSLYDRYYRSIVGFIGHFGFTRDESRDLAQDVFVRVFEHLDVYRGDAEWRFLAVTARNVALNHLRSIHTLKRHARTVGADALIETPDGTPSPETALAESEEKKRLHDKLQTAISSLPAASRDCLILWLREYTYTQIQEILGISMDAVKSRLHDARLRLRTLLAEEPTEIRWPGNDHDPQK